MDMMTFTWCRTSTGHSRKPGAWRAGSVNSSWGMAQETSFPFRPDLSGLVVPGDATSLTRVDLDNDGRQ